MEEEGEEHTSVFPDLVECTSSFNFFLLSSFHCVHVYQVTSSVTSISNRINIYSVSLSCNVYYTVTVTMSKRNHHNEQWHNSYICSPFMYPKIGVII